MQAVERPDKAPSAENTLVTDQNPLELFALELQRTDPAAAMRLLCMGMRRNLLESGRTPSLSAYLHLYGLRVEEAPIPTAGRLDYEDGRYVVRVQRTRHRGDQSATSSKPPQPPTPLRISDATDRQRFTIAHEIGHAILFQTLSERPEMLARLRDPARWADVEALCDVAAGELLAPLEALLPLLSQRGSSMHALVRLARRFRVAQEALYQQVLAAGALSLSLWRVSTSTSTGAPVATLVRVLAQAPLIHLRPGYALAPPSLSPAPTVHPEIVVEAARQGRAQAETLTLTNSQAPWHGAGIAACHERLGARVEQPLLLHDLDEDATASQPTPADALVTLLLLPPDAPSAGAPLWTALASV